MTMCKGVNTFFIIRYYSNKIIYYKQVFDKRSLSVSQLRSFARKAVTIVYLTV